MSRPSGREQIAACVRAGDERRLRAALCRLLEPDEWTVNADRVIGACGVVDAFARLLQPGAAGHSYLWDALSPRLDALDIDVDLGRGEGCGARFVIPGDAEWPRRLDALPRPPYGLWIRGALDLSAATERSVAVIGSRASTAYGDRVAGDLTAGLALRGWTVVSGGAYGIDAAAHRAALAVPVPTVAVLASGVDVPYPVAHTNLIERIAASGLVVSEQPPGDAPRQLRFLARNRIVAALTRGTVVVEAGLRSGTTTTARQAGSLSRAVMVVPGPVDSWASKGCHELLRKDPAARLVVDASQIIEEVGQIGVDLAPEVRGPARTRDGLKINTRRVLDAVPVERPVPLVRLAVSAGVGEGALAVAIKDLQRAGFVEVTSAGVRLSGSERARRGMPNGTGWGTIPVC